MTPPYSAHALIPKGQYDLITSVLERSGEYRTLVL